jgi:Zn finger protein HypA/HybF involved in hydrogenase expression
VTDSALLPCQLRSCIFLHSRTWLKYTQHVVRSEVLSSACPTCGSTMLSAWWH